MIGDLIMRTILRTLMAVVVTMLSVATSQAAVADSSASRRDTVLSTVDIVRGYLVRSIDQLYDNAGSLDTISLLVNIHPDQYFIRSIALDRAGQRNVVVAESADTSGNRLVIVPHDVSTIYRATDERDTVERIITVDVGGMMVVDGIERTLPQRTFRDITRMSREEASRTESTQHRSTHGTMPARPTSLWSDIVEPVVFVAAAVVTVVLLFTVRSQ